MVFDRKAYMKEYYKKYYKKNKDKLDSRVREWQKDHPDQVKKWARKNREENKEQLKAYRKANGKRLGRQIREYRQSTVEAFLAKKFYAIKKKSKLKARYAIEISLSDLLELWDKQGGRCAISGKKMEHVFGSPYTVSVDRINSDVGYKRSNLQLVCQSINYAKNSFTNEEFLYFWTHDELSKENSNPRP